MHKDLIFTFLVLALAVFINSQKAILMSGSLGYYNYRQVSNIVKLYHHLRHNGFTDDDIILLIGQMQPCCEKNHLFGTLSFYDGDYTNIFKNIEVDYYQSQMTSASVSNILLGYYGKYTLNKKKLNLKQDQPLFIYITGHGGDTYFKIRQKQAIIDEQFTAIFKTLTLKNITNKNVIISDSCGAITPFEKVTAHNFLALGSSSLQQKSLSHGYDIALNQPKTDDFSFYFDEILSERATAKGLANLDSWTFNDVHKYMDVAKLKVNSKLITNKFNKNQKISSYIKRKSPQIKFKKYSDIKNVQQFFNY